MLNNPVNITKFYWYSYCLNNPLKYSDPSGMLREALPNYADLGYIYNPEGAAWLANYYYQSMLDDGGSGGYGGDSPWVNNYLNYSHACSENGGEASISDFDNKVNTSSNGSITIQTGTLYVYNWSRLKDEKVWHIGTFRNTEPIYSTIQVGSSNNSRGWIFGQSIDITIATPGGGYTGEKGWFITENGKKGEQFVSHGISFGLEATVGWNLLIINPKSNFKFDDLKGQGASWTANFWILSISAFGNSSPGYPENSIFDTYKGFKIGIGAGFGGSTAPNSNTTFQNWIPDNIDYMNFHWH